VSDKVLLSLSFSSCKLARFSLLFFPSIMCFWFYTLSRFCGRGFPGWPIDKSSSPSISLHHESDRPSFVCILSQFLLNLLVFPFCSYPLLCVSGSILLSRLCARGFPVWRTEKSSSPSISSHHESDRPSFVCILSQFYERGFADRCYRTLVTRVRGIHLAPKTFVLYNSTPELLELASLPLPTMTLSVRPAFPYLVESSKFRGFTHSRVQKS
jgi:hypothetical protein